MSGGLRKHGCLRCSSCCFDTHLRWQPHRTSRPFCATGWVCHLPRLLMHSCSGPGTGGTLQVKHPPQLQGIYLHSAALLSLSQQLYTNNPWEGLDLFQREGIDADISVIWWLAEEFQQAVGAEDWTTAHSVLVTQLAPGWWCSNQNGQLQSCLTQLEATAGPVQAAVGPAAWKAGAHLYSTYFRLQAGTFKHAPFLVASYQCLCASHFNCCYLLISWWAQWQDLLDQAEEGRGPSRLQLAGELAGLLEAASSKLSKDTPSDSKLFQQVCTSFTHHLCRLRRLYRDGVCAITRETNVLHFVCSGGAWEHGTEAGIVAAWGWRPVCHGCIAAPAA